MITCTGLTNSSDAEPSDEQATDFNIYDPENMGTGDINYWVFEGNVGATDKFTRNGGKHIRVRRTGSPSIAKATHETMMNPAQQSPAGDALRAAPEE